MTRAVFFLAFFILGAAQGRPVPNYTIDLDLPPEERYAGLFTVQDTNFNATVWRFYEEHFANKPVLTKVLYGLAAKRGPENEEQQREIEGLAALSQLPLEFVHSIQMLYELQTLMVPIVNFTGVGLPTLADYPENHFPAGYEGLAEMTWRGPGCTGIVALNGNDGQVYHARNLDFQPVDVMLDLVYNGVFTQGGVEVFRSQLIAGYTMVITAANFGGSDGYALERNTRYADHAGGYQDVIKNLEDGVPLNGWSLRKILEAETAYDGAVAAVSSVPYASPEYAIVSGVKKGVVLSRSPDMVVHQQVLGGEANDQERADYVIMTNFDFYWRDVREWFDPTGGLGAGHPRRVAAQQVLNAAHVVTPEVLWAAINAKGNFADTVFQAIINVEQKLWNISIPDARR